MPVGTCRGCDTYRRKVVVEMKKMGNKDRTQKWLDSMLFVLTGAGGEALNSREMQPVGCRGLSVPLGIARRSMLFGNAKNHDYNQAEGFFDDYIGALLHQLRFHSPTPLHIPTRIFVIDHSKRHSLYAKHATGDDMLVASGDVRGVCPVFFGTKNDAARFLDTLMCRSYYFHPCVINQWGESIHSTRHRFFLPMAAARLLNLAQQDIEFENLEKLDITEFRRILRDAFVAYESAEIKSADCLSPRRSQNDDGLLITNDVVYRCIRNKAPVDIPTMDFRKWLRSPIDRTRVLFVNCEPGEHALSLLNLAADYRFQGHDNVWIIVKSGETVEEQAVISNRMVDMLAEKTMSQQIFFGVGRPESFRGTHVNLAGPEALVEFSRKSAQLEIESASTGSGNICREIFPSRIEQILKLQEDRHVACDSEYRSFIREKMAVYRVFDERQNDSECGKNKSDLRPVLDISIVNEMSRWHFMQSGTPLSLYDWFIAKQAECIPIKV